MGEGADESQAWPAPLPHSSAQLYSLAEQGFPAMEGKSALLVFALLQTASFKYGTMGSSITPAPELDLSGVQTACSSSSR